MQHWIFIFDFNAKNFFSTFSNPKVIYKIEELLIVLKKNF